MSSDGGALHCVPITVRDDGKADPNGLFIGGIRVPLADLVEQAVAQKFLSDPDVQEQLRSKQAAGEIRRPLFFASSTRGQRATMHALEQFPQMRVTDLGKLDLQDGKLQQTPKTASDTDFFSAHVSQGGDKTEKVIECGVVRFILTNFLSMGSLVNALSDRWMQQFMIKLDLFPVLVLEDLAYFEMQDLLPLFPAFSGKTGIPVVVLANFKESRAQTSVLGVLGIKD